MSLLNFGETESALTASLVFVRTVAAVVRAVTHPVVGNAAVISTFKLGGCAKFVCKRGQRAI